MDLNYTSLNFPRHLGPAFQGRNTLQFSVQELMWAAVTVGRSNIIDVLSHGIYSEYEILYRASIIVANMAYNGRGLVKSSAYESLDPSEKSAVSYFLGLTMTKLLANRLLATPWLLHLDVYKDQFSRNGSAFGFGSSRKKPDLIGLNINRDWIVFESKGRTNRVEADLLTKAKSQTRNLRRIGRALPSMRIGMVTYFVNGELFVDWEDPDEVNDKGFDLETDSDEYLSNYYRLIYNILSNNETREFNGYITHNFDAVNLTIGLKNGIYNAYKSNDFGQIQSVKLLASSEVKELANRDVYSGADGILVGLGKNWRELLTTNKRFNE